MNMKNILKYSFTLAIALGLFAISTTVNAAFPVEKSQKTEVVTSNQNQEGTTSISQNQLEKETANQVISQTQKKSTGGGGKKSQVIALILCLFLGGLGIHRFYLGYTWQGVVQLLTAGGFGIWAIIDLIRIIIGDLQPKDGSYDKTF
jgi:TM2 domain-containing membrane protein YozV